MRINPVRLKPTRADILLSVGVGLLCVAFVLILLFTPRGTGDLVCVEVDGEIYGNYSLNENQRVDISGHNLLVIEDGRAFIEWADCPDQSCMRQALDSTSGGSIICLPNRVVITVATASDGVDAIAGGG